MLLIGAMKTLDNQSLETVTGGSQTVAGGSSKLDDATTQALTRLQSDIKDLAKNGNQSSTTQLVTMMVMSKMMRG